MDTNKTKPTEQQTNKSVRWKLPEFRKHVVKKCMEGVIMESGVPLARLSGLVPFLERFEAKVHASAKNEAEYIQWLSEKVKEITSRLKSSETKPRPSNSTGSAEILSVQEAGKSANTEWKEQVYQKAQRMNSAYFPKVSAIYQQMRKKLQELESSPQELNKVNLERMRNHKKIVENILAILRVSKCQITIDFKEKLDKAEKLIVENLIPKNASSRHQGQQHSTDVQSRQQSSPSHSSVSQMKMLETKPSPQALGKLNYHMVEDISQQNRMCLQEQQVAKQFSNSQQDVHQLSIIKGAGNTICHQGQQHAVAVQSRQKSGPSHSSVSPVKILETKPLPQALGKLNYHMIEDASKQNKMRLQEQQVAKQYSNSQQDVKQLSIIKGTGNAICHQGQQHSVDVQSRQKYSSVSTVKILETKPSPQALGKLNYHMIEDVSKQNKMCLQEQQVTKQYSNPQQDVRQLSIIKGTGNAICHQGQQHSVDVQSRQKSGPPHSSVSPVKILETKPSPQALGKLNYHMIEDVCKQNKMHLQEQQVAKQYSNSQQDVKQLSIIKGTGNTICYQGQQHSVDVQSRQKSGPSHSSVSPVIILETKPSPQALGKLNYQMIEDVSKQNKMHLQEQQVTKQYSNSQQDVKQLSIIKGTGNAICHQGQQHSVDVQSWQKFGPSHSSVSPVKILETKQSPQELGKLNYHMIEDVSKQNKMCLQEQQVAKQYSNSEQNVKQLSIIKGMGETVQQQTQGAQKATEAFSVSVKSQEISGSPLIENCNKLKEISHKPTVTSDEPSAAMQRFLKVLTSISPEALSASVGEIRDAVYLNDVTPSSELINGPPNMVQQLNQPHVIPQTGAYLASDIEPCSQARYITCNDFVPTGRKRSRSINAVTTFDTSSIYASSCDSNQLTNAKKPNLTSVTSKIKKPRIVEKCSLLVEIKEINNLLIDSEIVIGEKDSTPTAAGGATEHGEGLVIKLLFNAVTFNQNLTSHLSADKKSIIKPLWLLVPANYPYCPPVILEKMPLEVRSDQGLKDLSTIAKSNLRLSLQRLNQPWSLRGIAMLWERCAREAILEYAQCIGGGTFSSIHGGWKMCPNYA